MSDSVRPHRRQPTRLPHPWDSPGKNTGVGCHFLLQSMKVKREREVAQSCPTLSMDCSLPGSSIHGIFQARVLGMDKLVFRSYFATFLFKYNIWVFKDVNLSIFQSRNHTKKFDFYNKLRKYLPESFHPFLDFKILYFQLNGPSTSSFRHPNIHCAIFKFYDFFWVTI